MPKLIDCHSMEPFMAELLKSLQDAPSDELGRTHDDILFSEADSKNNRELL